MPRLIRITTVPMSLDKLLEGQMGFMQRQGMEVLMVSADGPGLERIVEREGCPHRVVDMTRSISPLRDLRSLYQMIRLFREWKPDIVHTHTPKAGLIGMMAAWWCRVPVRMHTVAGLPLMEARGIKRVLLATVERIAYRCADHVYPNSFRLRDHMVEAGLSSGRKLKVIGKGSSNGIDTSFFKADPAMEAGAATLRQQYGMRPDEMIWVFVGRIVKDKGVNELLEAFDLLSRQHAHIRLLLVGPIEDHLDPISNESRFIMETNPRVTAVGYQQDVRPFLYVSDAFVLPSYREGFPNVPLQAGCFGLPCVVTDVNGCNEIIEQNVNGLLVPPKNAQALRAAMETLILDPGTRRTLGGAARERIVANYRRELVWDELLAEYKLRMEESGIRY